MRIRSFAHCAAMLILAAGIPVAAQQATGYLKTKIDPGRAGVFIDGKYVGPAGNFGVGRKYALPAGDHEVRLVEPRYEEFVGKVTVQSGKTVRLAENLKALPPAKPPFGSLRTIASDKFAAVYVNGKFMGHAGEFNNPIQALRLNPGDYGVKIVPLSGSDTKEVPVKIEADKVTVLRAQP